MSDGLEPLTAALTADAAAQQALDSTPIFTVGTAQGVTDEDGYTSVLLDGPEGVVDDEDSEASDVNPPVPAQTLVRGIAPQERAVTFRSPSGALYAIPYANGLIGAASIEGGATDIAVVSTSAVAVTDLEATAEVQWPDHLIEIQVNMHLSSGAGSNTLTGRVIREDEEGNTTEVARFLRSNQMGNAESIQVGVTVVDWAPEPGVYTFYPTIQAAVTGWSIILDPATTPETAASLVVYDKGPLPTSAVRTTP